MAHGEGSSPSSSDRKSLLRDVLKEDKVRRVFHSFIDTRQLCIINRVCKWWSTYLSGPSQDHELWREVNLSICAPHAATDHVLENLFKNHRAIQHLDLKFCGKITDKTIEQAASLLKDLRRVEIEGCGRLLSDAGIRHLKNSVNLTALNINGCQRISTAVLESVLRDCKSIQFLSLAGMSSLEDKSLAPLLRAAPQLRTLSLNSCSKLTNLAVDNVAKSLKNLEDLDLAYCANIDDDAVHILAQHSPNLTRLNLYGCVKITDSSLQALGNVGVVPNKLKKLNLSMCRSVTDVGLRHLLEGKRNCSSTLEWLILFDCNKITSTSLILLGKKCPRLKFLEVPSCDGLDGAGLEKFLSDATKLEKLDCGGCQKISASFLETLHKRYQHLFT